MFTIGNLRKLDALAVVQMFEQIPEASKTKAYANFVAGVLGVSELDRVEYIESVLCGTV